MTKEQMAKLVERGFAKWSGPNEITTEPWVDVEGQFAPPGTVHGPLIVRILDPDEKPSP